MVNLQFVTWFNCFSNFIIGFIQSFAPLFVKWTISKFCFKNFFDFKVLLLYLSHKPKVGPKYCRTGQKIGLKSFLEPFVVHFSFLWWFDDTDLGFPFETWKFLWKESSQIVSATVMLATTLCWLLSYGDSFKILVAGSLCISDSIYMMNRSPTSHVSHEHPSVTNISKLSPIYTVSNIRRQYRFSHLIHLSRHQWPKAPWSSILEPKSVEISW